MTKTRPCSWLLIYILAVTFVKYSVGQSIGKLTVQSKVIAIEGQETTLPCYYVPTNAVIGKFYWKKGDEVIIIIARKDLDPASRYSLSDPTLNGTSGYVSLTIKNVTRRDTDSYWCGVNDESTGATILFQKNCTLTVYYLDKPTLSVLGGDLEVVRGSKVALSCNSTEAYPKPITKTWFHDNNMLKFETDTLKIESFEEKNEGQYSCKVENDKTGKISNAITLKLKDEATLPPASSSSSNKGAIVATIVILVIIIIVIIGVVVYRYDICSRNNETTINRENSHSVCYIVSITTNNQVHKLIRDPSEDLSKVIHRNTKENIFRAGGVFLYNDRFFLLLNDKQKYIMCKGMPGTTQASPIEWKEEANVLLQTEQLLSYAVLPGIHSPYILVGVVNVSKSKSRIKRKLITILPNRNPVFRIVNDVIETLELNGSVDDLKFDYLSGKRLSNGRLVVGGWVKRKVNTEEKSSSRIHELRVKYLPLSSQKQTDIEDQPFIYQPFIMWTDNENDWNIVYVEMDNAEDNMRIQLIETGNCEVCVIISLLQSRKVLYEGLSEDNCTTFERKEEKSTNDIPVVSVALSSDGMFVCAPAISKTDEDANHKETRESATEEPLDTERKQGVLAGLMNSVTNQGSQSKNQHLEEMEDDNPNNDVPTTNAKEVREEQKTDETTKKRSVFRNAKGKVSKALGLSSIKKKTKQSSDSHYESVPTTEGPNETPKEEKAAAVVEEREETEVDEEEVQGTSQQEPDESTPCVHEEESKEKEKRRSFMGNVMHGITKPFKTEGKSKEKTKKESKAIEEELPSNQEKSNKKGKTKKEEEKKKAIEFEGLWHFFEDTTDSKVIRLKPIHARSGEYNSIDILQNRSNVKCEQIVPFLNDGKSWFLMIYTTHFEEDDDRGHCIRYHVFSLDSLKKSMNN